MAEQYIHTIYSVADIERYLQGKMNAKEMHDMEKAALQDPFLSDAIEGYKSASFTTSYKHLNEIAASFASDKQKARVIVMPMKNRNWWKVAAAVVIVAAAGIVSWLLMNNGKHSMKELAENKTPINVQAPLTDSTKTNKNEPATSQLAQANPVNDARKVKNPSNKQSNVTITKDENTSIGISKAKDKTDTSFYFPPSNAQASLSKHITNEANTKMLDSVTFKGLTSNNIAGNISNNAYSNNASPKGPSVQNNLLAFNNKLTDTTKAEYRNSTASNYIQSSKANKSVLTDSKQDKNGHITVVLTPTPGFDSGAVTYLNNKNFSDKIVADTSLIPQGGWESFRDYVYKKLHQPIDTTADDVAYGDVEIEFTVDDAGIARNLRITKSLDKQSDAQAMELVSKWPGWVASKKHKKSKVVIQF